MKALLDEQLSPRTAMLLRQRDHDVVAVADRADLVGCSDRILFEVAGGERRALITNNALADAIERVLHEHPDGPAGSERWIGPLPRA